LNSVPATAESWHLKRLYAEVNFVQSKSHCLFWVPYKTCKYAVWAQCKICVIHEVTARLSNIHAAKPSPWPTVECMRDVHLVRFLCQKLLCYSGSLLCSRGSMQQMVQESAWGKFKGNNKNTGNVVLPSHL